MPEYARVDVRRLPAHTDTLGDLGAGLSGSALAALLTVTLLWRFQKEAGTNRFRG